MEFYTSKELVDELMSRQTFLGVIIHSKAELKEDVWQDARVFEVHFNKNAMTPTNVSILLNAVDDILKKGNI